MDERVVDFVSNGSGYAGSYKISPISNRVINDQGGMKDDGSKLDWTILPWNQLKEVVEVLDYGARLYSRDNWKKVEPERYKAALMRHVVAYINGEKDDADSKKHHLAHAICDALFLMYFDSKKEV